MGVTMVKLQCKPLRAGGVIMKVELGSLYSIGKQD